ncbi:hypothetical protein LPJ61_000900 [Coemansia biformis]|uniref:Zn(2)-C6 fungal-type domain-containing protein n=1 Tax=Coemansia biformis TaxID=1286918 RepID=A0A9W7YFE1_9FUNG|nr:hypothetical protein LPJ61_000900 [Coemansia biformis]
MTDFKPSAGVGAAQPVRLLLSCDNCRQKKIRCNGGKPVCANCQRIATPCHYSQVGPRKKPRRPTAVPTWKTEGASGSQSSRGHDDGAASEHRSKRRAPSLGFGGAKESRRSSADSSMSQDVEAPGLSSISQLMLERIKESKTLELPQADEALEPGHRSGSPRGHQSPVMEMLRLQTQISGLVDEMRNLTIRMSGESPLRSTSPHAQPDAPSSRVQAGTEDSHSEQGSWTQGEPPEDASRPLHHGLPHKPNRARTLSTVTSPLAHGAPFPAKSPRPAECGGLHGPCARTQKPEQPVQGIDVSRDMINHLIDVYFEYGHPAVTGMYPIELYKERLRRAQVSEPFLLSTLAVASRFSEDPRVKREPVYLAGYDFFERVTRGRMMDVLERDCVENMLTLNNLAVFAVGLPVANRGWYFSGLAMRMATQMSLQKVDAPGRMPGASMMSSPGIESARRAFWTTLLLEALASFASGEPPPITIQDIHVAEPFDDPSILNDDTAGLNLLGSVSGSQPSAAGLGHARNPAGGSRTSAPQPPTLPTRSGARPNMCAHIAQLSMLLIRVARLNGNRHPEAALFSPEYAALHTEMTAWYHGLPDSMQVKAATAKSEIAHDPRLFAAKMFVHCHYQAAIIALHQPRVDLVRVESTGGGGTDAHGHGSTASGDQQWRQLARQHCLTAACTMTELLALARPLDVRYCIVTFGFAVFMAGVVHVGAVACTPHDSNERQYSVNCVKEHVRCLDRLGKYFAFHFIMAKHIRAQLQTIEAADLRRQKAAAAAASAVPSTQPPAFDPAAELLGLGAHGMPFGIPAALGMSHAPPTSPFQPFMAANTPMASLNVSELGAFDPSLFAAGAGKRRGAWPGSVAAALGGGAFGATSGAGHSMPSPSSVDLLLGLFGAASPEPSMSQGGDRPAAAQCPGPAVCAGLCGAHSPATAARMVTELQGLSGMAGLGSGIGSLVELFSSGGDGCATVYPQNILNNSSLAPRPHPAASTAHVDPSAPLRLTVPGGMQRFGSLPPQTPL